MIKKTCTDGHSLQRALSPFLHQKGVKTSLSLVNEFTGADVSLDKAVGGRCWMRGFKSLATKEKREGVKEREGNLAPRQLRDLGIRNREQGKVSLPTPPSSSSSYYCISRCTAQARHQYCQTTATVITGKSVMKHLHARLCVCFLCQQAVKDEILHLRSAISREAYGHRRMN